MKRVLNIIYYSLCRILNVLYPYQNGGYSDGVVTEIVTGIEVGIASLISALVTKYVFRYFTINITVPFLFLLGCLFLIHFYSKKNIWDGPDNNMISAIDKQNIDFFKWDLIALFLSVLSPAFGVAGLFIFALSLSC